MTMQRQFLNHDEVAIFEQEREKTGVWSATVYGPCPDALTAWNIASTGCDADHIDRVIRLDAALNGEDVTDEVAAALIASAIITGDTRGMPRFVDMDELEILEMA